MKLYFIYSVQIERKGGFANTKSPESNLVSELLVCFYLVISIFTMFVDVKTFFLDTCRNSQPVNLINCLE